MRIKNILKVIPAFGLMVALSSCTSWLTVDPVDQILEDQVYKSEGVINMAVNGMYLKMATENIYGAELTINMVETLGQVYFVSGASQNANKERYYASVYDYTEEKVKDKIEDIWNESYNLILNINLFIKKMSATEGVVSKEKKNILLGEAYALRAYMHFDLLRLFGPVYANDPTLLSIPYYTLPEANPHNRKPANEVVDDILGDINTALELLENDPIVTGTNLGEFYSYRNRRMNYYAVYALKLRVMFYAAGNDAAKKKEVGDLAYTFAYSDAMNTAFPWTTNAEVYDQDAPDRIFSNEVMFGIEVPMMYSWWLSYFSQSVSSQQVIYAMNRSNVVYMFDDNANFQTMTDYRASNWRSWKMSEYICTDKFSRPSDENAHFLYLQPLMRKSEIFLIAAEGRSDVSPLNEVRTKHNIDAITNINEVNIRKEYMKEFQGEGQIFYYYKRLGLTNIRGGAGENLSMNSSKYVVPIPDKELEL